MTTNTDTQAHGGGVDVEAIARAICKGRGLNPEVQNQGPARDGTVDGHWDINSPFGRPYDNRWHYGWRNQVEAAQAVLDLLAASPAAPAPAAGAANDVLAERRRQIEAEGWSPDHDDEHDKGEMAAAAISYASRHNHYKPQPEPVRYQAVADAARDARESLVTLRQWSAERAKANAGKPPYSWPWDSSWWKPKDRRSDLVRAAALLIAEIERLDRACPAPDAKGER